MGVRLSSLANRQIQDIWLYTEKTWGEEQATIYVNGLFDLFDQLLGQKYLWRTVPRPSLRGVFFTDYREHFVFFRQLTGLDLGILAVLHHRQDIPNRLKEIGEPDEP